jgi:hypothetical protein
VLLSLLAFHVLFLFAVAFHVQNMQSAKLFHSDVLERYVKAHLQGSVDGKNAGEQSAGRALGKGSIQ